MGPPPCVTCVLPKSICVVLVLLAVFLEESFADVIPEIDFFHFLVWCWVFVYLFLTCAPRSASPSRGTSSLGSPALSSPAPFAPPRSAAAPLLPSSSPPPSLSPPRAGEKTNTERPDINELKCPRWCLQTSCLVWPTVQHSKTFSLHDIKLRNTVHSWSWNQRIISIGIYFIYGFKN